MIQEEKSSLNLITNYFLMERYERIVEMLNEDMGEHINNQFVWYYLGYSHFRLKSYELAEEEIKEALRLGMDKEASFHLLGLIYLKVERWSDSEEALLLALRLNPNNADVHASYAYLMELVCQNKKASMLIKKAIELDPENGRVLRLHYLIENVGRKKRNHLDAIQTYMNSNDTELDKLIHLGLTSQNLNETKEAQEYFASAFALNPNNKELLQALKELEITNHPLLALSRWAHKIGMHYTWIVGIGLSMLLFYLNFELAGSILLSIYVSFCIYIWVSEPIAKYLLKKRR